MDTIKHNLELIDLSKRYSIYKNSEESYSVVDNMSNLVAHYDIDNNQGV